MTKDLSQSASRCTVDGNYGRGNRCCGRHLI